MAVKKKTSDISGSEATEIIRAYYHDIYKYCYWKIGNCTEAQDITQETFLRFIQNLARYSDYGKPKAFLYTIARNLCINWHQKTHPISMEAIGYDAPDLPSTDEMNTLADKISLADAISTLPADQQELLLLRYGQDLPVNEIASILGVSRFVVMYRLKGAIRILQKKTPGGDGK